MKLDGCYVEFLCLHQSMLCQNNKMGKNSSKCDLDLKLSGFIVLSQAFKF